MVDNAYYGVSCPCCSGKAVKDVGQGLSFDEDMLAGVLREIYEEEVKPEEGDIPIDLYKATRDIFSRATAEGMSKSSNHGIETDEDFLLRYTHSIDVFSAFRSHKFAEMLADMMHDEGGRLRGFDEWRNVTEPIRSHFNRSWLRTEYDTAILRAEQAADWRRFEHDKDLVPNLRWMPTSSATPREEHSVFWRKGLTLPVDDPFWSRHHPGDLWNCKCWLDQTDEPATAPADVPNGADVPKPAPGLENNPGKTAEMFGRKHPYYPKSCGSCPFGGKGTKNLRKGIFLNSAKNDCSRCKAMKSCLEKLEGTANAKEWLKESVEAVNSNHFDCKRAITVCGIPDQMAMYADKNNIKLSDGGIRVSDTQILHSTRSAKKNLGKALTDGEIQDMAGNLRKAEIYYDSSKRNFVFVVEISESRLIKYIVQPEYKTKMNGKKEVGNHFITGGRIRVKNEPNWDKIK